MDVDVGAECGERRRMNRVKLSNLSDHCILSQGDGIEKAEERKRKRERTYHSDPESPRTIPPIQDISQPQI